MNWSKNLACTKIVSLYAIWSTLTMILNFQIYNRNFTLTTTTHEVLTTLSEKLFLHFSLSFQSLFYNSQPIKISGCSNSKLKKKNQTANLLFLMPDKGNTTQHAWSQSPGKSKMQILTACNHWRHIVNVNRITTLWWQAYTSTQSCHFLSLAFTRTEKLSRNIHLIL